MNYDLEFDERDYDDIKRARGASQNKGFKVLFGRVPPSMPVHSQISTEEDVVRELAGRVMDQ